MKRIPTLFLVIVFAVLLFPMQWVSIGAPDTSGSWLRRDTQQDASERLVGLEQLDSVSLATAADPLGSDPRRWRARLAEANRRYQDIFPGVDLIFAGSKQKLEAVLIV